jgi:hypothetical protein
MAAPKRGAVAGINVKTDFDVNNPGVKTVHIPHHNGDNTKRYRCDRICGFFQTRQIWFLVHHAAWQVGNPDALLFVFVVAGNAFAGRHY